MPLFRRIAHWSPRYLYSRIRVEHFKRKYGGPHLAIGAVEFLAKWLKPTDVMLEYGSGYSTPWFGLRVSKVISVENDPAWHSRVTQQLERYKVSNVDLRLLNEGPVLEGTAVGADYISILQDYPLDSFDVVLNDGWARAHVATRSDLVKPGGVFIWDDYAGSFPIETHVPGALPVGSVVQDAKLLQFMECTRNWRRIIWDDGVHSTAAFFRPC